MQVEWSFLAAKLPISHQNFSSLKCFNNLPPSLYATVQEVFQLSKFIDRGTSITTAHLFSIEHEVIKCFLFSSTAVLQKWSLPLSLVAHQQAILKFLSCWQQSNAFKRIKSLLLKSSVGYSLYWILSKTPLPLLCTVFRNFLTVLWVNCYARNNKVLQSVCDL